jgi:hypothetical protein
VTFQDKFPNQIEFEFDRLGLTRYYRFQAICLCYGIAILFSSLLAMALFEASVLAHFPTHWWLKFGYRAIYLLAGFAAGGLFGSLLYFGYFRQSAQALAGSSRLIVEGPYLRYVHGVIFVFDKRYHFRDIHTYTTIEGPYQRRHGMKSLQLLRNEKPSLIEQIEGLKNFDQVPDMLCEIDAARTDRV